MIYEFLISFSVGFCVLFYLIRIIMRKYINAVDKQPTMNFDAKIIEKHINFRGTGRYMHTNQIILVEKQDGTRVVLCALNKLYNTLMNGDAGTIFYKEYKGEFHLVDFQVEANKTGD